MFADDTKVYSAISTTCDKDCNELQDDLSELSVWSDLLELCFNAKKCKSLHIGRNIPRDRSRAANSELLNYLTVKKV